MTNIPDMLGVYVFRNAVKANRLHQAAQGKLQNAAYRPKPQATLAQRTPEQIMEQLEARYAEMKREAENPKMMFPCKTCRWVYGSENFPRCTQPLVVGFSREKKSAMDGDWIIPDATLCGPEKALWEPKLTRWQKLRDWFLEPWVKQ